MTPTDTLDRLDAMPHDERFSFLCDAWDRLFDSGWQPTLDDETKELLDQRIAAADANPGDVSTWEEIVGRIRSDA